MSIQLTNSNEHGHDSFITFKKQIYILMKKTSNVICIGITALLFFVGCRKGEEAAYQIEANARAILNVAYGNNAQQTFDVYLPPNRTSNTSVIILVHGGSFIGGDKSEFAAQAKYLASSGYAVLNVNYRLVDAIGLFDQPWPQHLTSAVKVKDQVADLSTIVDFAIAHAKEWVTSSNRIGIVGHSAGATLALLYGYDVRNSNKIQAVSNLAGALDMIFTNVPNWRSYPSYVFEGGYRYTGYDVELANEQYYKEISPLYTANAAREIAILNVFPQNNNVAGLPKQDINTYNLFTTKLNELNVPNEFVFVAGADHEFSKTGNWQFILDKTVTFFNENIK